MTEAEVVIGVRQTQAIAAPLSHWYAPQWVPPPPSIYKEPKFGLMENGFFETLV